MATTAFVKRQAIDFGFETSKKNIFFFISIFAAIAFTYIILGLLQLGLVRDPLGLFILSIIRVIVGVIISMGLIKIALEFIDKKKPRVRDILYKKSIISILNYFLVSSIRSIIVLVGFILFIIPGIILFIKLQFATYLVVDKNMGVFESLSRSWEMTKGVKWNLFLFWLSLLGINIIGFLCLIIGLVITVPLSMVATAYVYRKLL
jgi:uncharacterized membrane protein